ncbi:cadherin-like beta sandwich domain-containing protein [Clostridium butyricum]|uniref:cadherin-like beta sandwich domain-containing protein n=1 Tax=Clostridium butyricum TaxID=1492 RepID=UPI000903154D|nr:cadherin-like beta sandwich domain-containing protein [Clostridium butyricum]APF24580.1 cell wall binding repeat family protein [Clostridium butyricum]
MNKNIKKIIAMTLTLCAVSAVCGVKNLNLSGEGTVAAFASDKSSLNLESISLSTGKIDFSSDVTSYKVYYNKAVKNIDIKVSPEGSDKRIRVTINDESVSSDDSYKKNFKLSVGENVFKIKIENRDDESQSKTYTLKAYRGTDENDQEIEQDLYINYLTINGKEMSLSKDKKVYDYKVDKDVKEAKIVIEPDQKYYTVKIGDNTYEGEESIKKTFTLTEGKNEIKIKLTDGEDEEKKQRTYTLNIYRGVDIPTSSTTTNNNTTNTGNNTGTNNSTSAGTTNTVSNSGKWQQNSAGKWYYVDSNGTAAKNKWFFVQGDGTMATGWVSFGGSWYYLNDDGTMVTEWLNNGGKWYYLGSDGAMKTGWVQLSGNWYYLYSDGSMACNTTIDSYKLGSDGAWIK